MPRTNPSGRAARSNTDVTPDTLPQEHALRVAKAILLWAQVAGLSVLIPRLIYFPPPPTEAWWWQIAGAVLAGTAVLTALALVERDVIPPPPSTPPDSKAPSVFDPPTPRPERRPLLDPRAVDILERIATALEHRAPTKDADAEHSLRVALRLDTPQAPDVLRPNTGAYIGAPKTDAYHRPTDDPTPRARRALDADTTQPRARHA